MNIKVVVTVALAIFILITANILIMGLSSNGVSQNKGIVLKDNLVTQKKDDNSNTNTITTQNNSSNSGSKTTTSSQGSSSSSSTPRRVTRAS